MANASIKAAFEQFWQHVIAKIGDTLTDSMAYTEAVVNNIYDEKMDRNNPIGFGRLSMNSTAVGEYSTAIGYYSLALGDYSYSSGYETTAKDYQCVVGRYNRETTAPTGVSDTTATAGIFMVGVGISKDDGVNGFRVNPAGKLYSQSALTTGSGADYAEYFEWVDGNVNNEDRRGRFVTLDGENIRYATAEDEYILGIVSAVPSIIGDGQTEMWRDKYLNDIYGAKVEEVVEVEETTNENGVVIPAHIERRWVLNPEYDPNQEYIPREERPEWDAVGIIGKLVVIDDGSCEVNGYCCPSINGIATMSESKTPYRVMERLDATHVKVFIR